MNKFLNMVACCKVLLHLWVVTAIDDNFYCEYVFFVFVNNVSVNHFQCFENKKIKLCFGTFAFF